MHGPAFNDKGELVEREVPEGDVPAFQNAGYVKGGIPVAEAAEVAEAEAPAPAPVKKAAKGKKK